jgi:hypothetical protein
MFVILMSVLNSDRNTEMHNLANNVPKKVTFLGKTVEAQILGLTLAENNKISN